MDVAVLDAVGGGGTAPPAEEAVVLLLELVLLVLLPRVARDEPAREWKREGRERGGRGGKRGGEERRGEEGRESRMITLAPHCNLTGMFTQYGDDVRASEYVPYDME